MSIKKLYVRQISADFLNRQIYNISCNLFIDTYCIRFEQKKEENTMNYSCYISKHLYERVKSAKEGTISLTLDQQEKDFLDFFKVQYRKDTSTEYNYLVNSNELKNLFCNQ